MNSSLRGKNKTINRKTNYVYSSNRTPVLAWSSHSQVSHSDDGHTLKRLRFLSDRSSDAVEGKIEQGSVSSLSSIGVQHLNNRHYEVMRDRELGQPSPLLSSNVRFWLTLVGGAIILVVSLIWVSAYYTDAQSKSTPDSQSSFNQSEILVEIQRLRLENERLKLELAIKEHKIKEFATLSKNEGQTHEEFERFRRKVNELERWLRTNPRTVNKIVIYQTRSNKKKGQYHTRQGCLVSKANCSTDSLGVMLRREKGKFSFWSLDWMKTEFKWWNLWWVLWMVLFVIGLIGLVVCFADCANAVFKPGNDSAAHQNEIEGAKMTEPSELTGKTSPRSIEIQQRRKHLRKLESEGRNQPEAPKGQAEQEHTEISRPGIKSKLEKNRGRARPREPKNIRKEQPPGQDN